MSRELSQSEFDDLNRQRDDVARTIVAPRARTLLTEGLTPKTIAAQMRSEGYSGRTGTFGLRDVQHAMSLAAAAE